MKMGWPTDLTWYALFYSWQTLIAGLIAILAAIIAYRGSLMQVNETRLAALGRKRAYTAMAALEAQRIEVEASRQLNEVMKADEEHLEIQYTLSRIEIREVLRAEWEQLGSLDPDSAFSVYYLIDAIDVFNATIAPRDELYKGAARKMLEQIRSKARAAAKLLTDELEKS